MDRSSSVVLDATQVAPGGSIVGHVELAAPLLGHGSVDVELWHDERDFGTELDVRGPDAVGRAWASATVAIPVGAAAHTPIRFTLPVPDDAIPAFSTPCLLSDEVLGRSWSVRIVDVPESAQPINVTGPSRGTEPRAVVPASPDLPRWSPSVAESWAVGLVTIIAVVATFAAVFAGVLPPWTVVLGLLAGVAGLLAVVWTAATRDHIAAEAMAVVTMPPHAVRPGEELVVDITVGAAEPLAARVVAWERQRHYVRRSFEPGQGGAKEKVTMWIEEPIVATAPVALASGPNRVRLPLPDDAAPSYGGERSSIAWRLVVGPMDHSTLAAPVVGPARGPSEIDADLDRSRLLDCIDREFIVEPRADGNT
ncbi:MAG: hypothetical protein AAF467_26315 [Actinomycetota bacterium]